MKRIVLLFASLLTMSACSSNQDSLDSIKSYRIDDPISSSYRMVEYNGNLLASGLTDSDKVTKYKDAHSFTMNRVRSSAATTSVAALCT